MNKRNLLYMTIATSLLLAGCQQKAQKATEVDTDLMIAGEIESHDQEAKKDVVENQYRYDISDTIDEKIISQFMNSYFKALHDGILHKSAKSIQTYIIEDSEFYKQQVMKIDNFSEQGIRQELKTFQVVNWYEAEKNQINLQTFEEVTIHQPNKKDYTKSINQLYTLISDQGTLRIKSVEPYTMDKAEETKSNAPAITRAASLNEYNGKWSTSNSDLKGAPIVEFYASSSSEATVKIHAYKPPNSVEVATVEAENIIFKHNQAVIHYDTDNNGNKGTIVVTLKANSLFVIHHLEKASESKWTIPAGAFELSTFES
ncbi:hypothetical protein P8864_11115 [Priestia flexa]|uniref:TcaA NTF2-like domain-containing protein n=1 Tax=Priestia flexa TaxID=86664 RepID=UPI000CAFE3F0|nr:hypothetical protein [Priestia flexa]MEC0666436.1 hypothetical protein [Priestia flexa]MED3822514.1 hypothetical protein [Priestia flexa]